MHDALIELRKELLRLTGARAQARLWRWRGQPDAACQELGERLLAWLASDATWQSIRGAEALAGRDSADALRLHLASSRAKLPLAGAAAALASWQSGAVAPEGSVVPATRAIDRLATCESARQRAAFAAALEPSLAGVADRWLDACISSELAWSQRLPGGHSRKLRELAERVLENTRPEHEEHLARLKHAAAQRGELAEAGDPAAPTAWQDLVFMLRAPHLDEIVPNKQRWRRVAQPLLGLGFGSEVDAHLRAEPSHGGLCPVVALAGQDAPREVRVAPGAVECGALSEMLACEGLARALGLALVSVALPPELRCPAQGSVARAFGSLLGQLHADAGYQARRVGLHRRAADELSLHTGVLCLARIRMAAARVLATAGPERSQSARLERGTGLVSTAMGSRLPPSVVAMLLGTQQRAALELRVQLAGLALHTGLRERLDEDWYRNPRAQEPLRAACQRGATLCAERWCSEWNVTLEAGIGRVRELLKG
ncbi:MAG: hypothetical protein MJD61_19550 [Proteobacteria bacterium]|nr:hypothetical protein [Pseudomonadota bacterium]